MQIRSIILLKYCTLDCRRRRLVNENTVSLANAAALPYSPIDTLYLVESSHSAQARDSRWGVKRDSGERKFRAKQVSVAKIRTTTRMVHAIGKQEAFQEMPHHPLQRVTHASPMGTESVLHLRFSGTRRLKSSHHLLMNHTLWLKASQRCLSKCCRI